MTPILEIQNLSHIYSPDTPFEHPALTNVDLTIGRGEFVGLIGHTGSGKSTLVQHMNGLLKPTSGRVLFDGRDIWEDAKFTRQIRFHVGLVMQYPEYQLFEETVYTDIAFGPKNMGLPQPGKSSCFFCPSMRAEEIIDLREHYPDLFRRALAMEDNARANLKTVQGLGRNYSWRERFGKEFI